SRLHPRFENDRLARIHRARKCLDRLARLVALLLAQHRGVFEIRCRSQSILERAIGCVFRRERAAKHIRAVLNDGYTILAVQRKSRNRPNATVWNGSVTAVLVRIAPLVPPRRELDAPKTIGMQEPQTHQP